MMSGHQVNEEKKRIQNRIDAGLYLRCLILSRLLLLLLHRCAVLCALVWRVNQLLYKDGSDTIIYDSDDDSDDDDEENEAGPALLMLLPHPCSDAAREE